MSSMNSVAEVTSYSVLTAIYGATVGIYPGLVFIIKGVVSFAILVMVG